MSVASCRYLLTLLFAFTLIAQAPNDQALFRAVQQSSVSEVKRLLDAGANPNAVNEAGSTPLMWAIPDLAKVKLLIDRGANVNARSKNFDRTPLLVAAAYPGTIEILKLLLDKGADLQAKDRAGADALIRAAQFSDLSVAKFLHERGIAVNQANGGSLALIAATNRAYEPTLEYLLEQGAKLAPQQPSIQFDRQPSAIVAKIAETGTRLNATQGNHGRTPLTIAAATENNSAEMLRILLDRGADPNQADGDGETPLDWAMHRNDAAKIAVLKEHGAKEPTAQTKRDETYPAPEGTADLRTALTKSVALLQSTAGAIYKQRGCISCHQQMLVESATAAARAKGITVNENLSKQNMEEMLKVYTPMAETAMQGQSTGGHVLAYSYFLMAMADAGHKADDVTAGFVHSIAAWQQPDGSWPAIMMRPPMEYSTFSHTAMSIRALTLFTPEAQRAEFDKKIKLARSWMLAAKPQGSEEHAMRIMALAWSKAPRKDIDAAVHDWTAQQNANGGWSQLTQLAPDAYATGLTLYALHQAGVSTKSDVYKKGLAFLLKNQYADGSWFVKSRAFPVQTYMESGYPFGLNQWVSAGAACWASMAIAAAL